MQHSGTPRAVGVLTPVSIPFSSGQRMQRRLFCSAHKSHLAVSIPFSSGQRMQLHRIRAKCQKLKLVSIPFSSGQRMQRENTSRTAIRIKSFQSPFHRVKGCNVREYEPGSREYSFQSPFHRVKGCNGSGAGRVAAGAVRFQSPFHRVKGCNLLRFGRTWCHGRFQSPFHRVKGCNTRLRFRRFGMLIVSIPFSSGQRMQPLNLCLDMLQLDRFNPLFIGSKDATPPGSRGTWRP